MTWRTGMAAALLALGACSSATDPCPSSHEGIGRPALDLVSALQGAGAEVRHLGQRLDLTVFAVPTQVLSVNGEEVLMWEYCSSEQLARDVGLYGVGVYARRPPSFVLGPDEHLFTLAEVIARYDGTDGPTVGLLAEVMGPEVRP